MQTQANPVVSDAIKRVAQRIKSPQSVTTEQRSSVGFAAFKAAVHPGYEQVPHITFIDSYLEQVERYIATGGKEGIGRLIVNIPPRHGKTLNISRLFPAWVIGRNPDKRLMTTSYGDRLANTNSGAVRNVILSEAYQRLFPDIRLAPDSKAKDQWNIEGRHGGIIAAGVGGGITGHGAHLLIIDDPVKSRADAESETKQQTLIDWWGDAYTRLEEPGSAVIIMQTRWHDNDLTGYVLADGGDGWTVVSLPAIAKEHDIMGRQPGEALWADRYTLEILQDREAKLGAYAYAALYDQSPRPREGGLFDTGKIKVVEHAPDCKRIVRFYDLAVTAKTNADYTAGVKLGMTHDGEIVILDVVRVQKTAPDVQELIVQNAQMDGRKVKIRLEAEKAGIVQLDYLLRDERMHNFSIDAVPPEGDKYTRAGPFAARVQGGRVLMVRGEWNRAYLDELAMFPTAAHDDQVDASSGAYSMLERNGVGIYF